MSIMVKLLGMEWLKLRRRGAFWVAILAHAMILTIATGAQQYMHSVKPESPAFTLPGGWEMLLSVGSQMAMLMLLISVALLTASEAGWKTQRQNVIDGLSREQYFSAKIMVVVLLVVILWADIILVGLIVAPFGGKGALAMPIFSEISRRMLPNVLLYLTGIGIIGFMAGMIASSSGAAIAVAFAYVLVEPIIGGIMASQGGYLPRIARFLPMDVFGNLVSRSSYNAEQMVSTNAALAKHGQAALLPLQTSVILSILYIIILIGITWLAFRKRDL
jgi:ABC-2 type transport system permease protein